MKDDLWRGGEPKFNFPEEGELGLDRTGIYYEESRGLYHVQKSTKVNAVKFLVVPLTKGLLPGCQGARVPLLALDHAAEPITIPFQSSRVLA